MSFSPWLRKGIGICCFPLHLAQATETQAQSGSFAYYSCFCITFVEHYFVENGSFLQHCENWSLRKYSPPPSVTSQDVSRYLK